MLTVAALAALLAGLVNAIAGGGTLLSFPALLWLGLDSKIANATSTVGIWPGSLGGAWGYRRDLIESQQPIRLFCLVSLLGGAAGAMLLILTETRTFDFLVPWLILGATLLFMLQGPLQRWLKRRQKNEAADAPHRWLVLLPFQFLIALYGGYFGAGIGILMLAGLGLLGLSNLHQMNGIKNLAALAINGAAVAIFVYQRMVNWPVAVTMAVASLAGGYLGARLAKVVGPDMVRLAVIAIGLLSTAWTGQRLWN